MQKNIKRVIFVLVGRPDSLSQLSGFSLFGHLGVRQSPHELTLAAMEVLNKADPKNSAGTSIGPTPCRDKGAWCIKEARLFTISVHKNLEVELAR